MSNDAVEIGPEGISLDGVARLIADMDSRQRSALSAYRKLADERAISRARLLSYRCTRGCLLLDVFETTEGPALYWPRHRRSPGANAQTSPEARATRTLDGDRNWIDRAELVSVMRHFDAELNCDHVRSELVAGAAISEQLRLVSGLPRRHADRKLLVDPGGVR